MKEISLIILFIQNVTSKNCIKISIASVIAICQFVMSIMKFISNQTRDINEFVATEVKNLSGSTGPVPYRGIPEWTVY